MNQNLQYAWALATVSSFFLDGASHGFPANSRHRKLEAITLQQIRYLAGFS
jgi:hypothetical protein